MAKDIAQKDFISFRDTNQNNFFFYFSYFNRLLILFILNQFYGIVTQKVFFKIFSIMKLIIRYSNMKNFMFEIINIIIYCYLGVHFFIAPLAIQKDAIIYAITKLACVSMTRTHVDFALRMDLIVHLHMVITIFVLLSMTSKRYKHWKTQIQIRIHPLMDQIYLTRSVIWWTKTQSGKIQIMYSVIIKQNPVNVHQGSVAKVMLVHNITIVRIKDVVHASTSIGKKWYI